MHLFNLNPPVKFDLPIITPGGLSTILEIAKSLELEKLFDKHVRVKIWESGYSE